MYFFAETGCLIKGPMKLRLKTIQANLFCSYSALIMVSILIFGVFFYYYTSTLLKNRASQAHQSLCGSISEKLDAEVMKMNTVSMNICYSSLIKNHFYKYLSYDISPDSESTELKVEKYYNSKELMDIFMAIIGPSQTVSQINLYDFNGEMVGAGLCNLTTKISLEKKSWYQQVLRENGDKYISIPHPDPLLAGVRVSNGEQFYISLCRILFDQNWTKQGIVEINQDCDTIFHGLDDLVNREAGQKLIYVFNDQGQLLFPYNRKIDRRQHDYLNLIQPQNNKAVSTTVQNPIHRSREIVTSIHSEYTGWKVLIIESQQLVLAPVITFTRILIYGCIGLLLLTLLMSFALAKKVTIPIQRIHRAIKKLDLEMLFTQTQPKLTSDLNELEELNIAFQNMSIQLKKSMDALLLAQSQEMQSKMLALQSQMNPHFLYNTLSTMIIMTEEDMKDSVITMGKNVSHMLRYISSHKSPLVMLQAEIAHTRNYLECMKFRYRNNLWYEFQIDPRLNALTIPKLVIQPLVENAIKHGAITEPPWQITVKVFISAADAASPTGWRVAVQDNGPGFSREKLAEIRQRITAINEDDLHPRLEPGGMGLLNIYIRLKLVYQQQVIFQLVNCDEGGACVTIGGSMEVAPKQPPSTD